MTDNARDETLADTLLRLWNAIEENGDKADVEFDRVFARNFDTIVAVLRAAPPAPDTGMREALEDETAWLIELRGDVPMWWSLNDEGDGPGWTTHADDAVRFARKQDAQAYIDEVGWTGAFPSEHMWCSPRAALSRPPHVADTREGEDDSAWIVKFDDVDVGPEVFVGAGAREAALKFFERSQIGYNCHLFKRVAGPTRFDPIDPVVANDHLESALYYVTEMIDRSEEETWVRNRATLILKHVTEAIRALASAPPHVAETREGEWQPIESYPFYKINENDSDSNLWGPEVLVITKDTKSHFTINGVAQPEFTIGPQRVVAHLEAGMWLSTCGDDLVATGQLEHTPTHWMPIADLPRALASGADVDGNVLEACEHDWHIWPETDGQEQKCMKCGAYRRTPTPTPPPQADREAAREAVKAMKECVDIHQTGMFEHSPKEKHYSMRCIAALTAAIAKLGEE